MAARGIDPEVPALGDATLSTVAVIRDARARIGLMPCRLGLLLATALTATSSLADTADEIRHIEHGLRQAVAVEGKPVPTRSLADEMQRLHVPGVSIAVIRNGTIAWAKGYGVAYANGPAVTPYTLFQAASISKPVSATAALRMVEAKQLDLDADINTALTSWKLPAGPGGASATLRQLLSHTAGTTVHGFPGYAADAAVPTLVQVLDGAKPANTPPIRIDTQPGSIWRYSGGGYTIVQQALIDRSKKPFSDLLSDTVLKPFGMNNSTFAQPLPSALAARAALPHDEKGAPYKGGAYTYPELAAAGLWTTPSDLARFAIAVQRSAAGHSAGVLSPEMARTMLRPVKSDWGLGFGVEGEGAARSFGHGGSNQGFQSLLFSYIDHGDGVVVMTNGDAGSELAQNIMRAVAAEYRWPSKQTVMRKAVELSPAQRKALGGRYEVKEMGSFEIAERDGKLMFSAHGGPFEPVYAESPTVLFILSRPIELRLAQDVSHGGRLIFGPIDAPFERVK